MRVLILGGSGMLGHKLVQQLSSLFETAATLRVEAIGKHPAFTSSKLYFGVHANEPKTLDPVLEDFCPDVVINCIGIVKQQAAAKDPVPSIAVNSLWPHLAGRACTDRGARFIHISTDCVFSGKKGRYQESDPSDAEDLYGKSKYLGEVAAPGCLTLRTSIIGRELFGTFGLVEWFLSQTTEVRGYRQAIFSGFTTLEVANLLAMIASDHGDLFGLYQAAAEPINKHALLVLLGKHYHSPVSIVPTDEVRINRSLDGHRLNDVLGYRAPSWPEMVAAMATDPTPYQSWRSMNVSCK